MHDVRTIFAADLLPNIQHDKEFAEMPNSKHLIISLLPHPLAASICSDCNPGIFACASGGCAASRSPCLRAVAGSVKTAGTRQYPTVGTTDCLVNMTIDLSTQTKQRNKFAGDFALKRSWPRPCMSMLQWELHHFRAFPRLFSSLVLQSTRHAVVQCSLLGAFFPPRSLIRSMHEFHPQGMERSGKAINRFPPIHILHSSSQSTERARLGGPFAAGGCQCNFMPWICAASHRSVPPRAHEIVLSSLILVQSSCFAYSASVKYSSARSHALRADPPGHHATECRLFDEKTTGVSNENERTSRDHAMGLFEWADSRWRGNHTNGDHLLTPPLPSRFPHTGGIGSVQCLTAERRECACLFNAAPRCLDG
jgi:hypothetical protein